TRQRGRRVALSKSRRLSHQRTELLWIGRSACLVRCRRHSRVEIARDEMVRDNFEEFGLFCREELEQDATAVQSHVLDRTERDSFRPFRTRLDERLDAEAVRLCRRFAVPEKEDLIPSHRSFST